MALAGHYWRRAVPFNTPAEEGPDVRWRIHLAFVLRSLYRGSALPAHLDVYQFGVFQGDSMRELRWILPDHRLIGFDSFTGLPPEADWVPKLHWKEGQFLTHQSEEDIRRRQRLGSSQSVRFVRGYFNDTLVPGLVDDFQLRPALYVDIDSDLYVSARQALGFLFENKLAVPGTLIGYDDWWEAACLSGSRDVWSAGEARAHREVTEEYEALFRCVAGPCAYPPGGFFNGCSIHNSGTPVFVLLAVGAGDKRSTGFQLLPEQVQEFMEAERRSAVCAAKR